MTQIIAREEIVDALKGMDVLPARAAPDGPRAGHGRGSDRDCGPGYSDRQSRVFNLAQP